MGMWTCLLPAVLAVQQPQAAQAAQTEEVRTLPQAAQAQTREEARYPELAKFLESYDERYSGIHTARVIPVVGDGPFGFSKLELSDDSFDRVERVFGSLDNAAKIVIDEIMLDTSESPSAGLTGETWWRLGAETGVCDYLNRVLQRLESPLYRLSAPSIERDRISYRCREGMEDERAKMPDRDDNAVAKKVAEEVSKYVFEAGDPEAPARLKIILADSSDDSSNCDRKLVRDFDSLAKGWSDIADFYILGHNFYDKSEQSAVYGALNLKTNRMEDGGIAVYMPDKNGEYGNPGYFPVSDNIWTEIEGMLWQHFLAEQLREKEGSP